VFPVYYNIELIAYDSSYQGFHFGLGDPEYDYWGDLKPSSISQVYYAGSSSSTTSIASTTSSSSTIVGTSSSSMTSIASTTTSSSSSSTSYTPMALIGTVAALAVLSGVVAIGIAKSRRHQTYPDSMPSA